MTEPLVAQIVWTRTGNVVHLSNDGEMTRCGRPVLDKASGAAADYYGICLKCAPEGVK